MNVNVYVEINDKYLWLLRPFSYLFNIYWSSLQRVVVAGYSRPDFRLPDNFEYFQIDPHNFPSDRWSDGMIKFLRAMPDEPFVFLLSDYWMIRTVDVRGVAACNDYILTRPNVLRIDLTDDRLFAGGVFDVDMWGSYDIIETPFGTPYQMSTQAGIWNRNLMLELIKPNMSAWDVEINIAPPENMRVLGTRQRPVRYANALNKGKIDKAQIARIPDEHRRTIIEMIPESFKDGLKP